jgi:hypothetical protein
MHSHAKKMLATKNDLGENDLDEKFSFKVLPPYSPTCIPAQKAINHTPRRNVGNIMFGSGYPVNL